MKNSQIILCKNIKMDKNYNNVLNYSETDLLTICEANKIEKATNYSFVKPNGNAIDVSFSYSNCLKANYIAFQNPYYDNKWFFAFVDSVEYRNNSLTRITFTIDVFSTWFNKITLQTCFVEREHVNDDTVGANTIPEGVELGDYVNSGDATTINIYQNIGVCIGVTELPGGNRFGVSKVGGIVGGVAYLFCNDLESLGALKAFYDSAGKGDAIKSIFYFDGAFKVNAESGLFQYNSKEYTYYKIKQDNSLTKVIPHIQKITNLNGYTPINNKLLTFPYCYYQIDNNNGNAIVLKYEDFSTAYIGLTAEVAFTVGGSVRVSPAYYKGRQVNYNESFSIAKLPVGNFTSDAYSNWLAKNGTNIGLNILGAAGQVAGAGLAVATGGITGVATAGASSLLNVGKTVSQIQQSTLISPSLQGNLNNGDVNYLLGLYNPIGYNKTIKAEYARIIDNYFSCFGYKINRTKVPNITGRLNWNYVKTIGCNFTGEMSSNDLETIRQVFDRGVTIWHNYETMLDYSVSNTINSN